MSKEYWKDIPGYKGLYQASNLWKVKSLKNNLILKDYHNQWYKVIYLYKNSIRKFHLVHRLIALTFIWNSKLEINHINWIRNDNKVENLEYCTREHNMRHRRDILWYTWPWEKEILQFNIEWIFLREWKSISEAQRVMKVHHISRVCSWERKTSWGFIWKYK